MSIYYNLQKYVSDAGRRGGYVVSSSSQGDKAKKGTLPWICMDAHPLPTNDVTPVSATTLMLGLTGP